MKKYISIQIAALIGTFAFAMPAFATTAILSPSSVNVTAGESFTVTIKVDPQGLVNDVEKLEVDFPANTLKVTSFALGNYWMALNQSGYQLTDNTNGVLIETAGYPKGISATTTFGTITFYAKKSGSGSITVGTSSLAYAVNTQNTISGNDMAFTVVAAPVEKVATQTGAQIAAGTSSVIDQLAQTTGTTQVAASGIAKIPGSAWFQIVSGLILLVIIGLLYKRTSKPKA